MNTHGVFITKRKPICCWSSSRTRFSSSACWFVDIIGKFISCIFIFWLTNTKKKYWVQTLEFEFYRDFHRFNTQILLTQSQWQLNDILFVHLIKNIDIFSVPFSHSLACLVLFNNYIIWARNYFDVIANEQEGVTHSPKFRAYNLLNYFRRNFYFINITLSSWLKKVTLYSWSARV